MPKFIEDIEKNENKGSDQYEYLHRLALFLWPKIWQKYPYVGSEFIAQVYSGKTANTYIRDEKSAALQKYRDSIILKRNSSMAFEP